MIIKVFPTGVAMTLPSIIVSHILRRFSKVGRVLPSLVGTGVRYNVSYGENATEAAALFYRTTYRQYVALDSPVKSDRTQSNIPVKKDRAQ